MSLLLPSGNASVLSARDAGISSGFPWLSLLSDLKIGTLVATLPGALHNEVSIWINRSIVSIFLLCGIVRLICSFYLSVAACAIV